MKQKQWLSILLVLGSVGLQARYNRVKDQQSLESVLDRYKYSIVCFAPAKPSPVANVAQDEKRAIKQDFEEFRSKLQKASNTKNYYRYLPHDVGFVLVNISSDAGQDMAKKYGLDRFPSCLVFDTTDLVSVQPLINPQSSYDIVQFLEKSLGGKIQKMIKEHKQDTKIDRQQHIKSHYAYANTPYEWYAYPNWPYSRWGAYPYNLSWGIEYDN